MSEKIKLLCVEDDEDIRFLIGLALDQSGLFEVVLVPDATQAWQILQADGQQSVGFKPNLLLLDQMLPGMTGLNFLAQLHRKPAWQHLPAVLLTARYTDEDEAGWQQSGVLGLIPKPFDPLTLAEQLIVFWRKYQLDSCR